MDAGVRSYSFERNGMRKFCWERGEELAKKYEYFLWFRQNYQQNFSYPEGTGKTASIRMLEKLAPNIPLELPLGPSLSFAHLFAFYCVLSGK